jgi:signal transduction histidine kinase
MCSFCPRYRILDSNKQPTGIYHWEYYNSQDKRWYDCCDVAIEWIDGRLVHLEHEIDINERKLGEIELLRAREKAEESDNLKSAFLANMSHEIRTPLNGITGFLQFLNNNNLTPIRRQEYINIINNSSAQLVKLIDDIIDIAKIEAKQMSMNPVEVQINNLMTELHLYFETYMQNNNKGHISLILDQTDFIDNCIVHVDLTRLRQVITNLLNNAIKFTDKGYIRFGYRMSSPDKLEFVVEDTGIGIKSDDHEIIFERFRQVELTNKRLYGGTGLGLSISYSLIELMGGDLWVESIEGKGSTFYFTIIYLPITHEKESF